MPRRPASADFWGASPRRPPLLLSLHRPYPKNSAPARRCTRSNLARITDSQSGDLLLDHDALNRLTRIVSDQGSVEYQYDALGRRTRMSINGADPIDYAYDKSGRLTATTFRGKTARYQYDGAGRLLQKTLPNGIAQTTTWDAASRLTRIEYNKADGTPIDAIDYQYDPNGNRTEKRQGTDSLAETPMQASYDTGNRLTRIVLNPGTPNEKTYDLTYDEEGNLTSKTHATDAADKTTYTWNAKNQLIALSSPGVQASFKYDALGRRTEKTVNGDTVHYLYDGAQAIAELRNGAVSAAYHPGIELDEVLARYTDQGQKTLLQDALNSVIAQTDDSQQATNWQAYSPYGETQSLGPDAGNPLQYTGRENDRTGLYYYRARYYDPVLKRFIAEDPIGLAGGINVYAYVLGNPVVLTDPQGLMGQGSGANHRRPPTPDYCTMSPDFYPDACRRHDDCYRDACKSREQCDEEFLWDMGREQGLWMPETIPLIYFFFVRTMGKPHYGTP